MTDSTYAGSLGLIPSAVRKKKVPTTHKDKHLNGSINQVSFIIEPYRQVKYPLRLVNV